MNDLILSDNVTISKQDIINFFHMPQISDTEFKIFCDTCKSNNLNPLKREVYLNKYGDVLQIVTGYEVYLKRAEQSQKYAGMKAWTEGKGNDLKGCVEVYRKDWQKPLYHEVYFNEYCQYTREGKPTRFWSQKPITMIKKVAISQAFRLAFPEEVGGMPYTSEEMPENGSEVKAEVKQQQKSDIISSAQLKRLFTICSESKIENEEAKQIIKNHGYESSKNIKITDYEKIIKDIEDLIEMKNTMMEVEAANV